MASPRRVRIVANLRSGQSAARRREAAMASFERSLTAAGLTVEVKPTDRPAHAVDLAASAAAAGITDVVASGGDGTVREVVEGLLQSRLAATSTGEPLPRLGIWPGGTSNVLAAYFGLPSEPEAAAGVVIAGKTAPLRPGLAEGDGLGGRPRVFLMMTGAGFDAQVISLTPPAIKRVAGEATFWATGAAGLATWRPSQFEVAADGHAHPATFACVGRAPRYGGGFAVTPKARPDQRSFQICIVNTTSRLRLIDLLRRARGAGLAHDPPDVQLLSAERVTMRGDGVPVQMDGDLAGRLPVSCRVAPWDLSVLC